MITHNTILDYRRPDGSECGRMAQTYADGGWVVLDLNEMGSVVRVDATVCGEADPPARTGSRGYRGRTMSLVPSCSTLSPAEIDRVFFDENHRREAVAICSHCPVQQRCATYADTHRVPHGVWGGESGASRRRRLGIRLYPIAAA